MASAGGGKRGAGARHSQSLERGLALLSCFTAERSLIGISELSEQLGLSRGTTHRYARTLVSLGYLEQDQTTRKYRLALAVADLGMAALNAMELPSHAHAQVQALAERTGHTVDLAVLDGAETLLIDRGRPGRPCGSPADPQLGSRQPAYCTSAGKVLLAHLPPGQLPRLIDGIQLAPRGPKTITDGRALHAQLERAREEGLAVADEELAAGLCAIAAPIRDETGDVVAALSLVASTHAISALDLADRFAAALMASAQTISRRLGLPESRRPSAPSPTARGIT